MNRAVLAVALIALACGGSPTGPSPVQVGGVWNFTSRITTVTGGECFATSLQGGVGATDVGTIQITQSGSSLSAVVTSNGTGTGCSYSGTAGGNSISLNASSCQASDTIGAVCPSGARRDIRLVASAFNGTITGSTASGTAAETYNVLTSPGGTGVGTLVVNGTFTATRR